MKLHMNERNPNQEKLSTWIYMNFKAVTDKTEISSHEWL